MRLYRLHLMNDDGNSVGYQYFGSQREAEKAKRDYLKGEADPDKERLDVTVTLIEVTATKAGILRALNTYGGHADNG